IELQARSLGRTGGRPPAPGAEQASEAERRRPVPHRIQEEQQRQTKEEIATARELQRLGITFAFSTQGQSGDKPAEKFRENLGKVIAEGLPADAALKALTIDAARILGVDRQLGTVTAGKAAHLVVTDGDFHNASAQVRYVFADGVRFEYEAKQKPAAKPAEPPAKPVEVAKQEQATEIEADRKPRLHTGGNVLIRGATVLTVTAGTVEKTDILVRDGKIAQVGHNLNMPEGTAVIDAEGMFVMPGIIDTHSHFAIAGGVNEFSLSVVPEVRVRDVIDSEDVEIF